MPEAFYEPDGDGFRATELTRGPWDPGAQHAGPPAALIGREIERLEDAAEFQVGRITFEILRPVPIGAAPRRGQDRAARAAGAAGRGDPARRATASCDAGPGLADPHRAARRCPPTSPTRRAAARPRGRARSRISSPPARRSATTRRWSGARSAAASSSRARPRSGCGSAPAGRGEEPSPLQRTLVIADVGNGISAVLDWRRYLFINVDLTVHLERMPEGEWVCVDAVTRPAPERRRQRRVGALRPRAGGSAAPSRRCCSPSASGRQRSVPGRDRRRSPLPTTAIAGREQERALVVGERRGDPCQRRAEADSGVEEGGEGAERRTAPRLGHALDDDQRERGVEQREGRAHRQRAGERDRQAVGDADRRQADRLGQRRARPPPAPGRPGPGGRRRPAG